MLGFFVFMDNTCPQTTWTPETEPTTTWAFDGCLGGAPAVIPVIPPIVVPPNNPEAFMDDTLFFMDDSIAIMDS